MGYLPLLLLRFSPPFLVGVSTINSGWADSVVSLRDTHRWSTLVQRPGDWATILRMDDRVLPVPDMGYRGRTLVWDQDGNAATVAKLWGGLLVSPPLPAHMPGAAAAGLARCTPLCS